MLLHWTRWLDSQDTFADGETLIILRTAAAAAPLQTAAVFTIPLACVDSSSSKFAVESIVPGGAGSVVWYGQNRNWQSSRRRTGWQRCGRRRLDAGLGNTP
jgi:hypothetical protein